MNASSRQGKALSAQPQFVHDYGQVAIRTSRSILRHLALSTAASIEQLTGRVGYGLERPRIHFIYLHHVFDDEEDSFRRLLGWLADSHSFINYSEAVGRVRTGPIDRPYVSFSFDDGLGSCLRAGRILAEYGASACFFVCPPMAESNDYETIARFCRSRLAMPPTEFLTWQDMEELVKMGHEVGSHTMTHQQLSELSAERRMAELVESREVLDRRLGSCSHFAWPFGRFFHVDRPTVEDVFSAGYVSCASAERGAHVTTSGSEIGSLCIRRDQVVAAWPLSHVRYFLSRSGRTASGASNRWPAHLAPRRHRRGILDGH